MALFSLSDGVNEKEPTLIADTSMSDCEGAEYRVGEPGVFVARGRRQVGDVGAVAGRALMELGFDGTTNFVLAHEGDNLHVAPITAGPILDLEFEQVDSLASGSSETVGAHYASRHYIATAVGNRRLEDDGAGGVTSHPVGVSASGFSVTVSSQGSGSLQASTGLEYWVTEYDSVRGTEGLHGSTAHTGALSGVQSVLVTAIGAKTSPLADQLRWWRSTDGGGYPDGGLINTTPIGTTQITDTSIDTGTLPVPQYGIVSLGGLDIDRDEQPPVLSIIFGPFQDSLLGVSVDDPRVVRFTPAGFPDSWPSGYAIPLESSRQDKVVAGVVLPGRIGVFCRDSSHVIYRLPRDADSIFAAGEAGDVLTPERGCVSRRGAATFTPPSMGGLAAWVSRDGIWASNLTTSPAPLTDQVNWESRVDTEALETCRLVNDPLNRRLIFLHRRKTDTTHNTGIWYLDYQRFQQRGIRITFADHGALADAQTIPSGDGLRRVVSIDARVGNGQVYLESCQDVDDSQFLNAAGGVKFRARTKEFLPAGPRGTVNIGRITWMHDAGPPKILHRAFYDRRDDNPDIGELVLPTKRSADDVSVNRNVNGLKLEIESSGTKSYGVHWADIEGFDFGQLGGRGGA